MLHFPVYIFPNEMTIFQGFVGILHSYFTLFEAKLIFSRASSKKV